MFIYYLSLCISQSIIYGLMAGSPPLQLALRFAVTVALIPILDHVITDIKKKKEEEEE